MFMNPRPHSPMPFRLLLGVLCLSITLFPAVVEAQLSRETGYEARCFALTGARLAVSPQQTIDSGTIVIRDGLITAVGADVDVPSDAATIDGSGLVVYAGFIDAASAAWLDPDVAPPSTGARRVEFARDVLAATRPDNRRGLAADFDIQTALKTPKDALDKSRESGITTVHVIRTAPIVGGRSCLLSLSGAPSREAVQEAHVFTTIKLHAPPRGRSSSTTGYPTTLMGAVAHVRQALLDAELYAQQHRAYLNGADVTRAPSDPVLAALDDLRTGVQRALFLADSSADRDDPLRALRISGELELERTLLVGTRAYRWLEPLQGEKQLILSLDFPKEPKVERSKPGEKLEAEIKPPVRYQQSQRDDWQQRVSLAAQLAEANVPLAFSSLGIPDKATLLSQVRTMIEHGLAADDALAALTTGAAQVLGVDEHIGTLTPGKLAHLVVMTGPLEDKRSKVRYLFIDGVRFDYNEKAKPLGSDSAEKSPELAFAGAWSMTIEAGEEQTTAGTLNLTITDSKLSGQFDSEQGEGRVASGKIDGQSLEFTVAIGAGAREIELHFQGEVTPDGESGEGPRLSGTLKSPFGAPTQWSAERLSNGDSEPAKLASAETAEETIGEDAKEPAEDNRPTELDADRRRRSVATGGNVLVHGGTVLTGTGETLTSTSVLVRDGRIAAIGSDLEPDEGMTVVDAAGRFVMPGMIDTHSHIMIEGGANEGSQSIVPEVRIKDTVETDDPAEYRALAGGLTTARLLHGSANVIGGQHAVVKLKSGSTIDEHLIEDAPLGVKFALGENVKRRTDRFPNTRMGVEATLKRAFFEALDYRRRWQNYESWKAGSGGQSPDAGEEYRLPPRRDLRLEILADILNQDAFVHCHCYRADEILMLLRTAEELGFRIRSLQHVLEGYKIAPEIVAHGASCSTFSDWWAYKVEAYDATAYNAALLYEAGANIVIKSDNSELMRHLNTEAAKAVRYGGMPPDAALQMVTLNPARELGLDDRMGSIEVGKDADLAIFNGHPLSPFSRCEMTLIDGEVIFKRDEQPTAMTETQQKRSAQPPTFTLPSAELRQKELDLRPGLSTAYALVGGTVHPVDGEPISGGVVSIEKGRIKAVGSDVGDVPLSAQAKVIDVSGLHVYPGLIDAGTILGITEIKQVTETSDASDSGRLQPDLRAGTAVNVDSELIPVARAGGITTALIRPTGGLIAGQCSLMQTAGWTSEEMVLDYTLALAINWPRDEKQIDELREFWKEAKEYDRIRALPENERPDVLVDPRLEAMRPYLNKEKPVFIEADSRKRIAEALLFAEKEDLRIVITGGTDAWKLVDELKQREVPVIVGPTMRSPLESWDPYDATYANPGRLHEAGVKFCIRSNDASNSRNAPFEAAIAVAFGLPEEQALRAITLSAAEILGAGETLGSITPGKTANLIITDGSPLQQTTQIKGIFVAGQPFRPESRQTRFYERYRQRLASNRTPSPAVQPLTGEDTAADNSADGDTDN